MAEKVEKKTNREKETFTQEISKRKKKDTTSEDVPGSGIAKKAAKAIEKRKKMLESI